MMLKWGNVFEKIPHLRFLSIFASQGSQQKHSIDYSGNPIADAAIPPLDGSGPEEAEMKSLKREGKKKKKKKGQKEKKKAERKRPY